MDKPDKDFDPVDEILSAKLRGIAPPQDLRRNILAMQKEPSPKKSRFWLAIALPFAIAALVLALVFSFNPAKSSATLADARTDISSFLNTNFQLALESNNLSDVRTWLSSQNLAKDAKIPTDLASHEPVGCRVLEWRGHRVAMVCFQTEKNGLAHLFIFKGNPLDAPEDQKPQLAENNGWTNATWTDSGYTYLLFNKGDTQEVLKLLQATLRRHPSGHHLLALIMSIKSYQKTGPI